LRRYRRATAVSAVYAVAQVHPKLTSDASPRSKEHALLTKPREQARAEFLNEEAM